jgi:hypothetical protein
VQRWEYKVVSFADGRYTHALNEHGREGWELVSVIEQPPAAPEERKGRGIPVPRTLERIEEAASKLDPPPPAPAGPTLMWVLRRPLEDD